MEEIPFEQAVVEALRDLPVKQRETILHVVRTMARELKEAERTAGRGRYNVERHRAVRALTTTVAGSLAEGVSAERDERG